CTKDCNNACEKDVFTLVDRMNERFNVLTDIFCRSHILNPVAINLFEEIEDLREIGIGTLRLDFTDETREEVKRVLSELNKLSDIDNKNYTKGHYRRGVE
ncbi:MAG: U32 family peptidase, partial [Clostridium baratii]|nr:U32 family peptidase [Clostridium baratii]